ncbi:hypothetical protein RUM44_011975 [Polyplax serrata]|uniref:Centriolar and ciliogenesis-associated protein HYLS1 C-terminal domain-containing protein n=1 Tax=Polyplax serrata TaxID=468196 RepID=A0ABR1BDX0_POLSC
MLEPDLLNPNDVLAHLNALGFRDVTSQQLQDFLHDLKKLIKYEQKHLKRRCGECNSEKLTGDDSACYCSSTDSDDTCKKSINQNYTSSIATDRSSISNSTQENERLTYSSKSFKKDNIPKVTSSFIRPRNLPSHGDTSYKHRKHLDPVSLYHHYKELWKRNKIPGQTNHPQLRWNIRNKMLGPEAEQ